MRENIIKKDSKENNKQIIENIRDKKDSNNNISLGLIEIEMKIEINNSQKTQKKESLEINNKNKDTINTMKDKTKIINKINIKVIQMIYKKEEMKKKLKFKKKKRNQNKKD